MSYFGSLVYDQVFNNGVLLLVFVSSLSDHFLKKFKELNFKL